MVRGGSQLLPVEHHAHGEGRVEGQAVEDGGCVGGGMDLGDHAADVQPAGGQVAQGGEAVVAVGPVVGEDSVCGRTPVCAPRRTIPG